VQTGFTGDVYVSLLAEPDDDEATVRVIVMPLVAWLWVGGGVMFVGTMLAAFPGRRRDPLAPVSEPVPVAVTADT
jgi:cytochrome c-type biogenesis protein CcmF